MCLAHLNSGGGGDGGGGGGRGCLPLNVKQLFWLRWNLAHLGPMPQIQNKRPFSII